MADLSATYAIIGVNQLSGPADQAAASLGQLETRAGITGRVFGVLATATAAAGAGMAAGLGIAIKTAADFEKQLSAISAVSSKAELDAAGGMKALSDTALQLGKDTSFSASQAAAGMEEMVKAGISITDVLGGGARAALDLAAAGGLEVAEAASVAASAMNAFALAGSDMTHIADELAGASVASATDVHQLGFALAAVGAVAHTVGISFDDTTTAIAALAQAGLKGSDAGTSLKTMLLGLSPSTKSAKEEMQALGIITADGANQFFDATGKAKSMSEIAGVLSTATKGLTQEQRLNALQTIFGTDAIRAAAIMTDLGAAGMQKMAKDTAAAGSAQAIANERLNNLEGSLEKFRGSLETAAIVVGRAFLPALRGVVDAATEALNGTLPLIESWGDTLPGTIEYASQTITDAWRTIGQVLQNDWQPDEVIDPITNAIGEATVAFRDQFLPTIQAAWDWVDDNSDTIVTAFEGAAAAVLAFAATNTAIAILGGAFAGLLSPIALVAAAGAALAVAWQNDWLGIQGTTQSVIGWFQSTAAPTLIAAGTASVAWVADVAVPQLKEWAGWLRPKIEPAWAWLTATALPAIQAAGSTAWAWITGTAIPALQQWAQWLQPQIQGAWEWLIGTALPTIASVGGSAWEWITGTAVPALQQLADWMQPQLQASWEWLTATALPAIGTAADEASRQLQNLVTWFNTLGQALQDRQVYEDIAQSITNIEHALDLLVPLLPITADGVKAVGDNSQTTGSSVQTVADAIKAVSSSIEGATEHLNGFVTWLYNIRDALALIQNYMRSIIGMIPGLGQLPGVVGPMTPAAPRPPEVGAPPEILQPGPMLPPAEEPQGPIYGPPVPEEPILGPEIPPGFPGETAGPQAAGLTPVPISRGAGQEATWNSLLTNAIIATQQAGKPLNAANIMAAIPIQEGGWAGTSLQNQYNNLFSIKGEGPAGSVTLPTSEVVNGRNVQTTAPFRVYNNPAESFGDFWQFLQENPRYSSALSILQGGGSPEDFISEVNRSGYASDPTWAQHVISIARSNAPAPTGTGAVGALPAPPQGPKGGLIPQGVAAFEQTQQDWDAQMADANDICGPHLAALFASAVGRPPSRDEAVQVAQRMGIYQITASGRGTGILAASQFDEYATALIQQINPGAPFSVAQTPVGSPGEASQLGQESLAGGAPIVGFNTPRHYFGATGFDPATGKFHVGGTGTSLIGGSEDMTIQQMDALGHGITNVITLLGDFSQASTAASQSMAQVGATSAVSTTELSAIGTAIDPIVASFDEGTTSASQLADAIILSSENQGVAVDSTEAYKAGLTDQQTAMEGVLSAFAATTPAAADLLTQLQDGTISTDQAAIAFAGLATTTATATGALGDASTGLEALQTDGTVALEGLATDGTAAMDGFQADGTTAIAGLQDDGTLALKALQTDGVTAFDGLQTDGTTALDALQADGTAAVQGLQADATGAAEGMQADVGAATTTMVSDVSTALGGLDDPTQQASDDFGAVGSAADDATGPVGDFASGVDDAGSAAGKARSPVTSAGQAISTTGKSADEAAGPVSDFSDSLGDIKPPNLSGFIGNLKEIQKAAEAAKKEVGNLLDAKGAFSGIGKASGGPVFHDTTYLVGEEGDEVFASAGGMTLIGRHGPELFSPPVSGVVIPHHRLRGLALGGYVEVNGQRVGTSDRGIDYDKLAEAIVKAGAKISDRHFNVTYNTNAPADPVSDFAIMQAMVPGTT